MGHREKHLICGEEAPSVTQVLSVVRKPFLETWRGRLGNVECDRIMKESQELGHHVHEAIEAYFRGEPAQSLTHQEAEMFELVKQWAIESQFRPLELELHLESVKYLYHGTCDAIGSFPDGKLLMVDWKTSSGVDELYGAQLAAYTQAREEETGELITDGLIVRVDKKKGAKVPFEVVRFNDLPRYFKVFEHCLNLWRFVNKKGEWKPQKAA